METSQQVNVPESKGGQSIVKKPGAAAQIFGHFTKKEFWIELLEGIVKASVTAFFVALGDTLIRYGKKRGGAEDPNIYDVSMRAQSPAASAFSSRGYQPATEYRPLQNPPVPAAPPPGEWPGFSTNR